MTESLGDRIGRRYMEHAGAGERQYEIAKEVDPKVIIPDHYGGREDPYEVFKVVRAWELNFFLGNVLKYVRRAGKKDSGRMIEDLEKAREYLTSEIESLQSGS